MQYKTITIEHPCRLKNNVASTLNTEYESIINKQASEGWKLLGIHPINIRRRLGCAQYLLWGVIWGRHNYFQADVIIFFKDDSNRTKLRNEEKNNNHIIARTENTKPDMTNIGLKNNFNHYLSLDKEIFNYRKERIQFYSEHTGKDTDSRFLLLHIIPATFANPSFNNNMFSMSQKKGVDFSSIISDFVHCPKINPCVDGVRFTSKDDVTDGSECYINNNGIVECFEPLSESVFSDSHKYPDGVFASGKYWTKIYNTLNTYRNVFKQIIKEEKVFVCISIIGCKGIPTQESQFVGYIPSPSIIDRNKVICNPILFENLNDVDEFELKKKMLQTSYFHSLGIQDV